MAVDRGDDRARRFRPCRKLPESDQRVDLYGRLDTFGDRLKFQRPRERDDCGNEWDLLRRGSDGRDEGAVDLEDVDRESLEVAQRRIPSPEVVDRELHARGLLAC